MPFLAAIPAAFAAVAAGTATAAEVAIATGTAAASISAIGAGVAGYSAFKQNQFQGAVAKNNAIISEHNKDSALTAGQVAESAARTATGKRVGAAVAGEGASGIDTGFGSPTVVQAGLVNVGELDALTIRHNAAASALGYAQASAGYTAESSLDKRAAALSAAGGAINVASSLIGGASSVSSKYAAFQASGAMAGGA